MASLGRNLEIMSQVRRIKKQLNSVAALVEAPVRDVLVGQATLLVFEQRSLVAVDSQSENPVHVRDTIRVEIGRPTAKKAIVIRIKAGGASTLKAGKGSKAYDRARALEFGTEHMHSQPFFFPPYRARRKDIRAATRKIIAQQVKRVFK